MDDDAESLFYLAVGPLTAILLGMALVPLRGLTSASNFAFAFMAVTIVVAELGGRWAATVTALVSALSLDFFLTQPYLKLAIEDKHDVIAFAGLAVCGLIAASLGSKRGQRIATLRNVQRHRDLLRTVLRGWDPAAPPAPQLTKALRAARVVFPLAAAVLRDDHGQLVASTDPADGLRAVPEVILHPDTLEPPERGPAGANGWTATLPEQGGRIPLHCGARLLGWLDVWGTGAPAGVESRRALADFARLLALLLATVSVDAG